MIWDLIKATFWIIVSLWLLGTVFNFLMWVFTLNVWVSLAVTVIAFAVLIGIVVEITIRAWEEGR